MQPQVVLHPGQRRQPAGPGVGGVQTPPLEGDTCSWGGPRVRDRVCVRVRVRVCVVRARVRYT